MFHTKSDDFDRAGVNAALAALEERCRAFAEAARRTAGELRIDWSTEARYPDQAWEIEVPAARPRASPRAEPMSRGLVADFHRTHQEIFAVSDPASPIEIVGWNATVRCRIGSARAGPGALGATGRRGTALATRPFPRRKRSRAKSAAFRFETMPARRDESPARRSSNRASRRSSSIPARARRAMHLGHVSSSTSQQMRIYGQ